MALPTVKLARTTVELYPDLQVSDEVEAALDAVDAAKKSIQKETDTPGRTLASKALTTAKKSLTVAENALAEVKERAAASVLEVVIDQLPRKEWREFQAAHPVREGEGVDGLFAINWDTFVGDYLALPKHQPAVRWQASGEAVEVASSEWPDWVGTISDPEYQKLGFAIGEMNSRRAARPF